MENENSKLFSEFLSGLADLSYSDSESESKVRKAWEFANLAHYEQKRLSGDDYVVHVLEVAKILASWKLDITSIIAGLLHDTIEDAGITVEELTKEFGLEVATLVDGVSKVSKLRLRGSEEEFFVENLRKMFFAMAKDLRVVLIKLADRLHNMRTLQYLPEEKINRIAKETMEIYAPLAERLGMGEVKAQLNDLAFLYLYPEDFERVNKESAIHYKKAESRIKKIKTTLLRQLAAEGVNAKIDGRKKSLYSLWKKLKRPGREWDFESIYDIVALRILVATESECYVTLGLVHRYYKVMPGNHVSDYIAHPKPNGYSSLHTKVIGHDGKIFEIQIRTFKMHDEAEFGVAAHWAYSEYKSKSRAHDEQLQVRGVVVDNKLSWVKQLAAWQSEIKDSKEFLDAVKFDALGERIFVFSPKGDVFDLTSGATPVDFAYSIHTSLGDFISGAKVNGKVVPLSFSLKNGDVVEILKSKNPRLPNSDWLEFVKTRSAKSEIKKRLKQ